MPGAPALVCNRCGRRYPAGSGYPLECCPDGLLRGDYPDRLGLDPDAEGLWRFRPWLPVAAAGTEVVGSVTFAHEQLADTLGLNELWISFNGYWPERGGRCPTCSFKDLEVAPTLQRLVECDAPGVVVATAGNTGRAFAHLGGLTGYPVLVVVGEAHADRIWRPRVPQAPTTHVMALRDGDYGDAIEVAADIAHELGWQLEGGVRNVARRDGIGTLLLDAVLEMGGLPDHYVQAVGGGPGPIGVGDMAARLLVDGRYGTRFPRFHLVQNLEHQPVNRAWRARRSCLDASDFPDGPVETYADVLVNRSPAYEVHGGLFDLLSRSDGQTYAVHADAAREARALFESLVGIDIVEPAAVAVAGLQEAVRTREIDAGDSVLLAITGGGMNRLAEDVAIHPPTDVMLTDKSDAMSLARRAVERSA